MVRLVVIACALVCCCTGSGEICTGLDPATNAVDMLRGKKLTVHETEWYPYAARDSTTSQWSGFNIELLDELANVLGFTYDIQDMGSTNYSDPKRDSWTKVLIESAKQSDLVASFWTPGLERLNDPNLQMLTGHIDLAAILISRREVSSKSDNWQASFYSFLQPFTWELWFVVILMVLLSGCVDYLVEVKTVKETTITASLYEYSAGFLWGGFEYPLSKSSAVYQLIIGMSMLILISSCKCCIHSIPVWRFLAVPALPLPTRSSWDRHVPS